MCDIFGWATRRESGYTSCHRAAQSSSERCLLLPAPRQPSSARISTPRCAGYLAETSHEVRADGTHPSLPVDDQSSTGAGLSLLSLLLTLCLPGNKDSWIDLRELPHHPSPVALPPVEPRWDRPRSAKGRASGVAPERTAPPRPV